MTNNSIFIVDSTVVTSPDWNFPNTFSTLTIVKKQGGRIHIFLYGKQTSNRDYRMFLNQDSTTSGQWEQYITNADFIDLTLNSGFTNAKNNYGGRNALGYCKIGDIVYVAGGVGITNYSGTNTVAAALPSGYRPATNHYYFCATGGSRIVRVYIDPRGNITVEWIKNIDDGSTVTGEVAWIDLSTWFVAV